MNCIGPPSGLPLLHFFKKWWIWKMHTIIECIYIFSVVMLPTFHPPEIWIVGNQILFPMVPTSRLCLDDTAILESFLHSQLLKKTGAGTLSVTVAGIEYNRLKIIPMQPIHSIQHFQTQNIIWI